MWVSPFIITVSILAIMSIVSDDWEVRAEEINPNHKVNNGLQIIGELA